MPIDFKDINQRIMARANNIIPSILPGGSKKGKEWVCANIHGGAGGSCSINMETGVWADFSTGDKGGDIISLYAAQNALNQAQAATALSEMAGVVTPVLSVPVFPPRLGVKALGPWVYRNTRGHPVACTARYNESNGKKTFSQAHVSDGKWVFKSHPDPKPLYNLHLFTPDKPVLIVEGEKTADAASVMAGKVYVCTTWLGGSNAPLDKTDWSPVYGRKILICPDADEPGRKIANNIARMLLKHCPEVKVVDTTGQPEKWDLADTVGWNWDNFVAWVKPRTGFYAEVVNCEPVMAVTAPTSVTNNILVMPGYDETGNSIVMKDLWEDIGIPMSGANPINNIVTVNRVFKYDSSFFDNIWYDEFYRNILINGEFLRDDHEISITAVLQSRFGLSKMTTDVVRSAIIYHARNHIHNEPREYIAGLKWDGKPRVRSLFSSYFGTPDDQYHQDVAKYFMVSMIARILDPGCQADNMVILTGNQGIKKSTSLRNLVGKKWFYVSSYKVGTPDFIASMQGKLLMEVGEMSSIKKAHTEDVKMVCSNRVDRYRVPFDRHVQDLPRICLLSGTTNEDQFLVDDTGNRRFYPICPIKCEASRLSDDRDQLFSEAVQIYQSDPINWWTVTDEAEAHQEHHRIIDPWEDILKDVSFHQFGMDPYSGFKVHDVATKILNIDKKDLNKMTTLRISAALKKIGFRRGVTTLLDRSTVRIWRLDQKPAVVNGKPNGLETIIWDE